MKKYLCYIMLAALSAGLIPSVTYAHDDHGHHWERHGDRYWRHHHYGYGDHDRYIVASEPYYRPYCPPRPVYYQPPQVVVASPVYMQTPIAYYPY